MLNALLDAFLRAVLTQVVNRQAMQGMSLRIQTKRPQKPVAAPIEGTAGHLMTFQVDAALHPKGRCTMQAHDQNRTRTKCIDRSELRQ
jgi:hypothetical protein